MVCHASFVPCDDACRLLMTLPAPHPARCATDARAARPLHLCMHSVFRLPVKPPAPRVCGCVGALCGHSASPPACLPRPLCVVVHWRLAQSRFVYMSMPTIMVITLLLPRPCCCAHVAANTDCGHLQRAPHSHHMHSCVVVHAPLFLSRPPRRPVKSCASASLMASS